MGNERCLYALERYSGGTKHTFFVEAGSCEEASGLVRDRMAASSMQKKAVNKLVLISEHGDVLCFDTWASTINLAMDHLYKVSKEAGLDLGSISFYKALLKDCCGNHMEEVYVTSGEAYAD